MFTAVSVLSGTTVTVATAFAPSARIYPSGTVTTPPIICVPTVAGE